MERSAKPGASAPGPGPAPAPPAIGPLRGPGVCRRGRPSFWQRWWSWSLSSLDFGDLHRHLLRDVVHAVEGLAVVELGVITCHVQHLRWRSCRRVLVLPVRELVGLPAVVDAGLAGLHSRRYLGPGHEVPYLVVHPHP